MNPPSPPPPPDPYKTASAQTAANLFTAVAQSWLANADEVRPDGTVTFTVPKTAIVTEITRDSDGNVKGAIDHEIPRFLKTVTLSPSSQSRYEQQQQIAGKLNQLALQQSQVLLATLGTPVNLNSLTARPGVPAIPAIDASVPTASEFIRQIGENDITGHLDRIASAISDRLEWQINIDRTNRRRDLAFKGIFPGSVAFERDMLTFDRQTNDHRSQAILHARAEQSRVVQLQQLIADFRNRWEEQAFAQRTVLIDIGNTHRWKQFEVSMQANQFISTLRQHQLQEQIAARAQDVNELTSLMHGGQVQVPQFQSQPYHSGKIDNTPVGQYVYQTAAIKQQQWQTQVQQSSQMMSGMMGLFGNLIAAPMTGGASMFGGMG